MSASTIPSAPLRQISGLLRQQWRTHVDSGATLFRWLLAPDEWEWLETYLEGRLDGRTRLFVVEAPATDMSGYGFAVASLLLPALTKTKFGKHPRFTVPPITRSQRDVDILAQMLGAFSRHARGTWLETVGVVLAPASIADERGWLQWVVSFAGALVSAAPGVRVIVLDDATRPRYEQIAQHYPRAVSTIRADLAIAARTNAMIDAASSPSSTEGQLRRLTMRAMTCAAGGDFAGALRASDALEALAAQARLDGAVVPALFSTGSAFTGAGRHEDAVRVFRAAEAAAARAEVNGDPNGLWLRIIARFGVAASLLAAPRGVALAAKYYEETVAFCARIGDLRLTLEAHRCAATAHEILRSYDAAWNSAVLALGLVDRLTPEQRDAAMLVPLADAMLRMTETRALSRYRGGLETELRRRAMRGSKWE